MTSLSIRKTLLAAALIGATTLGTAPLANAQQGGYGMGPGMMGGYGPGYGMGPGMMGGYGMGPGMMGGPGYGMGQGMMGGYGMGPGMMGGGMGYGMLHQLNLTPEQWTKVNAIHEELAKKHWEISGKARDEAFKLRNLMIADKRDRAAVVNQFRKLQELRLQGFQSRLDMHEKIQAALTDEQRGQLRRFAPWWMHDAN